MKKCVALKGEKDWFAFTDQAERLLPEPAPKRMESAGSSGLVNRSNSVRFPELGIAIRLAPGTLAVSAAKS